MSDAFHRAVLEKLEFPRILERLSARCAFSVAAERALEVGPSGDATQVRYLLDVTAEAADLITNFPDMTIGGARDIRPLAERAQKGGRLLPNDLLLILDMLSASRVLSRSFFRLPDAANRYRHLADFVVHCADMPDVETDITSTVGPRGDVLDTASAELARIRKDVRVAHSRLMERLNHIIHSGKYASAVQDSIITMRDGRYVIPIRSDSRNQVPGLIHDTSSSGQTIFVEPMDVVELNNKWRERQIEEQHEIERVLDAISARIGLRAEALKLTVEAVAAFDLAMAKALLAFDMRAYRPALWTGSPEEPDGHPTHRIRLRQARHPLLDPATVVPTDIQMGETFRILLITGPNTGGKTVALKTVGLLTLMAQSGLFIPADEDSVISVFPTVFVDIGDEQSIAQSLSTFSSHMRNVIEMLRHVTGDSLVLLDELGAGTDPQEGSALARALIANLLGCGPLVIATTHYSEVKAFAYSTPGVENASVEFNVQTLSPTYRLMIGVPGRSNALAIAKRLGMPQSIVDEARGLVDPDELRADSLLQDIRRKRDEAEAYLKRAREQEKEAEQIRRLAGKELREAEAQRAIAREEALAAAEAELSEVRDTLRRLQKDREVVSVTRDHVETRRKEVDVAAESVRAFKRERIRRPAPQPGVKPISVGDRVQVISLGLDGEVIGLSDEVADVQLGSMKSRQPLTALRRIGKARAADQGRVSIQPSMTPFVPMEIDLRGQRVHEIPDMLERYLTEAFRTGLPMVRIIHGKGTGALRQVVRDYLNGSPVVARHETAAMNEGGDGATVAFMRE